MMISPEVFEEEHKNDSLERLIAVREELMDSIHDYENGKNNDDAMMPSPSMIYQCDLMYLAKVCELIIEKYEGQME